LADARYLALLNERKSLRKLEDHTAGAPSPCPVISMRPFCETHPLVGAIGLKAWLSAPDAPRNRGIVQRRGKNEINRLSLLDDAKHHRHIVIV